jgi:outer membrane protein OmpA-like peptidoglycan-associated protein
MNRPPLVSLALALCLTGTAACAHRGGPAPESQAFDPAACHSGSFEVYFRPAEVKLSAEAKAQIEDVRRAISVCRVRQISVVGLPDATADAQAARNVSLARANTIVATLGAGGVPRGKLRAMASGVGETARGSDTGDLMGRRAVIMVSASPAP